MFLKSLFFNEKSRLRGVKVLLSTERELIPGLSTLFWLSVLVKLTFAVISETSYFFSPKLFSSTRAILSTNRLELVAMSSGSSSTTSFFCSFKTSICLVSCSLFLKSILSCFSELVVFNFLLPQLNPLLSDLFLSSTSSISQCCWYILSSCSNYRLRLVRSTMTSR